MAFDFASNNLKFCNPHHHRSFTQQQLNMHIEISVPFVAFLVFKLQMWFERTKCNCGGQYTWCYYMSNVQWLRLTAWCCSWRKRLNAGFEIELTSFIISFYPFVSFFGVIYQTYYTCMNEILKVRTLLQKLLSLGEKWEILNVLHLHITYEDATVCVHIINTKAF